MLWKPLWKPEWEPVSETKRKRGTRTRSHGMYSGKQAQGIGAVQKNHDDRRRKNVDDSWYGVEQGDGEFKAVTSASNANDARRKASSYGRGARPFYQDANGKRKYLD